MILELTVRNYALIDSLRVEFAPGLNIFTGETGAGKSILVDAMGLVLGDRASSGVVRKGSTRAEISAIFNISKNKPAVRALKELSLTNDDDPSQLYIRREVDVEGRSRAFVNDRPVSLSVLSEPCGAARELHGQHENQQLLKNAAQRFCSTATAKMSPCAKKPPRRIRPERHSPPTAKFTAFGKKRISA